MDYISNMISFHFFETNIFEKLATVLFWASNEYQWSYLDIYQRK